VTTFLLDSDILDYLDNSRSPFHESCLEMFARHVDDDLCISILTIFELEYRLSAASQEIAQKLQSIKREVLNTYRVLPLSLPISETYGKLKASYRSYTRAKPKSMKGHTVDIILAATALQHQGVIVSNDRIFVTLQTLDPKLRLENWAQPNH